MKTWTVTAIMIIGSVLGSPGTARAQTRGTEDPRAVEAYLMAASDYFRVSPQEVMVLSEWRLPAEEIPVVLFVARTAGVSPDVVVSFRMDGTPWRRLASRYSVGPGQLLLDLGGVASGTELAGAYQRFEGVPRNRWGGVELTDAEIIALVNIRFLAEHLRVSQARVLEARARGTSFVRIHWELDPAHGGAREP